MKTTRGKTIPPHPPFMYMFTS